MLILMSLAKLGDFLLLTPHLREIQKMYPNVIIAVPDLLLELYQEQNIFANYIGAKDVDQFILNYQPTILNLSYPLIENLKVPPHHIQLEPEVFKKPQHATDSYTQALQLVFSKFPKEFKAQPFLSFDINHQVLDKYRVEPFHYFTVHSGSDFAPKNWPAEKFEKTVELLLQQHSHLKCISLVGPHDQELFLSRKPLARFQTIHTSLKEAAHLLNGSLFHIDNDSGVHHLAGALDVPSITVFGPTGPGTWSSLTKSNFIHWGGPNCPQHCEGQHMRTCENKVCLNTVEPEHLLASANKILSDYAISSLDTKDDENPDRKDS